MRIIACEQNSPQWYAARCGRVTGSRIADVVRKGQGGKPSKMRATYLGDLVAERLSGNPVGSDFKSGPMEWGSETEDEACNAYAFKFDVDPVKVGFVLHPELDMAGASPDRVIFGSDGNPIGGVETKCPNSATHLRTLQGAPIDPDYYKQVQWNMLCAEVEWWDFLSYDNRFPVEMRLHRERVNRNEPLIKELETAAKIFLDEVEATVNQMRTRFNLKSQLEQSLTEAS